MSKGKCRYALGLAIAGALLVVGVVTAPSSALAAPVSNTAGSTTTAVPTQMSGSHNTPITPQAMSDCPPTYFCVWAASGYRGGPAKFAGNNKHWSDFSSNGCPSGTWNDCASSDYNHGTSGLGVEVDRDSDYRGDQACVPKGAYLYNFSKYYWPGTKDNYNDSISSNYWSDGCY